MIDNVISAYEAVKMNGVSQGIIALCSFIAVIIVIQKFVTAWKEAFSEGDKPVDMKQFFKLFYIYIYVFAIIMVAPFAFTIVETALDKVVVVERSGEYLKTHAEDSEALFLALVKKTCAEATGYANSFDRLNLKKNQAHAAFYVNKNDLNAVFSKYYNDKAYFDAVQNGAVYKCEIDSIQTIAGDNEPYKVAFTSTLTIYGVSGQKLRFLIRTKGEIVRTTPQFPENVTGFFFNQFIQQIVRIEQEPEKK